MTRLLLAHKSDLMLDDWSDEAIIAASTAIVRLSLPKIPSELDWLAG
jgi:hypothetical protein